MTRKDPPSDVSEYLMAMRSKYPDSVDLLAINILMTCTVIAAIQTVHEKVLDEAFFIDLVERMKRTVDDIKSSMKPSYEEFKKDVK